MDIKKDFGLFARSNGVSSLALDGYAKKMGYINPTIVEERTMNMAVLDVFSRLLMDKIIFLGCEVCDESANIVNAQLLYLNSICDKDESVKIFINSPGGSVSAGLAIVDTMNFIAPDVSTYCMGLAASMGSIILTSGAKGKRYSLPHSRVLLHQPMGGTAPMTQESDFKIAYEELRKCKEELYKILSETTGQPYEKVVADADRDFWLTANEALDYGLIDSIITKAE